MKAFVEALSCWCFFSLTFVFANAALQEFIRRVVLKVQFRRVGERGPLQSVISDIAWLHVLSCSGSTFAQESPESWRWGLPT